ncbi:MAG: hypothetical protein PHT12_04575 [Patescibacteria group bacterium]|nr:hypothetical protein [Patescibacteria group bacterium]
MDNQSPPNTRRVGLDFDGVIVDHTGHKIEVAARSGLRLEPRQTNTNLFHQLVSVDDYRPMAQVIYGEMTETAPAVSGAIEHLPLIPGAAFIVSARRALWQPSARHWLTSHGVFGVIPEARVFLAADERAKVQQVIQLGLTDFLDDKLDILCDLPPTMRRWLFDEYGVADELNLPSGITPVRSWADFIRQLTQG